LLQKALFITSPLSVLQKAAGVGRQSDAKPTAAKRMMKKSAKKKGERAK